METYTVRRVGKKDFEIATFCAEKQPKSVSIVHKKRYYTCGCIGYKRQIDKTQHKHCLIVKFWVENLKETEGCSLWFENDTISYYNFIPPNQQLKSIFNLLNG